MMSIMNTVTKDGYSMDTAKMLHDPVYKLFVSSSGMFEAYKELKDYLTPEQMKDFLIKI